LIDGNIQISALSEALYQQVRTRLAELSDAQVLEQLEAAARLTVRDLDRNGTVDYGDVMDFMRSVDFKLSRGDIAALDALATGIRALQGQSSLESLSVEVLGKPPSGHTDQCGRSAYGDSKLGSTRHRG
jgi:hypothetical protein